MNLNFNNGPNTNWDPNVDTVRGYLREYLLVDSMDSIRTAPIPTTILFKVPFIIIDGLDTLNKLLDTVKEEYPQMPSYCRLASSSDLLHFNIVGIDFTLPPFFAPHEIKDLDNVVDYYFPIEDSYNESKNLRAYDIALPNYIDEDDEDMEV